jgi:hypothetical protein
MHAAGLDAYRVPLSGVSAGFKSDVELRIGNKVIAIESKVRSKGFGWSYNWLLTADAVVIKADRKPPLIILSPEEFAILLGQYRIQTENVAHKPLAIISPNGTRPRSIQTIIFTSFLRVRLRRNQSGSSTLMAGRHQETHRTRCIFFSAALPLRIRRLSSRASG